MTRQATANGGTIWSMATDGQGSSRFDVHPDGHLVSWSWQDFTPLERDSGPVDSGSITYTPLNDPNPIVVPEICAPYDPADFDLPDGFPIQRSDTPESEGVIPIPGDHVAGQFLSEGLSYQEILDRSQDMDLEFVCGRGAAGEWCALWDDGVVVVVPFSVPEDAMATISTPGHDGWLHLEIQAGKPFAIWHGEGRFHVSYEQDAESLGGSGTDFPSQR